MTIVGLPDAAVQESRERVGVNLAPASVRKEGLAYDLPIALGVIVLSGYLPHQALENTLVVGELSLDGLVRHTPDLMERNLNHRVEVVFPIEKPETIRFLRNEVLENYLRDNQRARLMQANGQYKHYKPSTDGIQLDVQEYLMQIERER